MIETSNERGTSGQRLVPLLRSIVDALRPRNEKILTAKFMLCLIFVFTLVLPSSSHAQEIEFKEDKNTGLLMLENIQIANPEILRPNLGPRDTSHSLESSIRDAENQMQSARKSMQRYPHDTTPPTLEVNSYVQERMPNLHMPYHLRMPYPSRYDRSRSIHERPTISLAKVNQATASDRLHRATQDGVEGLRQTAVTTLAALGGAGTGALVGVRTKNVSKAFKAGVVTANILTPVMDKSTRWLGNAIAESLTGGQPSQSSSQPQADLGHTVRQTALTVTTTIVAGAIGTGTIVATSDTKKGIAAATATANFVKPTLDIGTEWLGNAIGKTLSDLTEHGRPETK